MTTEELRTALEDMSFEQLLQYCDSFELEHPASKEDAINLLLASCPSCVENKLTRNANFVVRYLNKNINLQSGNSNSRVVASNKPCIGCNK